MNIKINAKEFDYLYKFVTNEYFFGSKLYGTSNKNSDTDIMCIYDVPYSWQNYINKYPSIHQFQYDDEINNTQYIFSTKDQFFKNQQTGDSAINSEIILFYDDFSKEEKLKRCKTYKVLKSFLGFAKRDMKYKNKVFHINRCLFIVDALLMDNILNLEDLKRINELKIYDKNMYVSLRNQINNMYENNLLENYYIEQTPSPLLNKLLNSNNTREFKYV